MGQDERQGQFEPAETGQSNRHISRRNLALAAGIFAAAAATGANDALAGRWRRRRWRRRGGGRCFLSGTAISTPEGIRTVESLSDGDLVLTESGVAKPIGKVVKTAFDRSESRDYRDAMKPVRIRRDAFGQGLPHSDLYLSPSHCVFVRRRSHPGRASDQRTHDRMGRAPGIDRQRH